jgi:hypothetical protein
MAESVQDLIAKRNYAKAIELLKAQLKSRPRDHRLRLQLADTLVLANKGREATPILMGLADEHASDGFAAKAIAILKRIEKIEPGRRDVEDRLARLIQEKTRHTASGPRPSASPAFELGLEEFDPSADVMAAAGLEAEADLSLEASPEPSIEPEPGVEPALELEPEPVIEPFVEIAPEPEPAPLPIVPAPADSDEDMAFVAANEEEEPAPAHGDAMLSTPLFAGFGEQELAAVIHGLKLLTFEPGDILVAEGAPGDSLFILSTGSVKAYVRNPKGHYMRVHTLQEGDFFGEISVLTGKPRTATLVAAEYCEVLELDKATLDSITKSHPQVREVLKKFREQRAQSTIEQIIKHR